MVPKQSDPVSPPPMITTRLPLAVIGSSVCGMAGVALVLLGQIVHGEVHALEFPAGDRQIPRLLRSHGQADGIEPGLRNCSAVILFPHGHRS